MTKTSLPERVFARIARILLAAMLLLTVLGVALLAALPIAVETVLRSRLKAVPGIERISVGVRRADPFGIELGPIVVGGPDGNVLEIDAVRVDFTPGGLRRGRLERVLVSGLDLRVQVKNKTVVLPGVDVQGLSSIVSADATSRAPSVARPPGIPIGPVVLRNGTLDVEYEGLRSRIPFTLTGVPDSETGSRWILDGKLRPLGQEVSVSGSVDTGEGFCRIRILANRFRPDRILQWMRSGFEEQLRGRIDLAGAAVIGLHPVSLQSLTAVAEGRGISFASGPWRLHSGEDDAPSRLELHGEPGSGWNLYGSHFVLGTPYGTAFLENLVVAFFAADHQVEGSGSVLLRAETASPHPSSGVYLEKPFRLPLRFSGRIAPPGHWHLDAVAEPETLPEVALRSGYAGGRFQLKKISVSVHGQDRTVSATVSAAVENLSAGAEQTSVRAPLAALIGGVDIAGPSDPGRSWLDFTLRLMRPHFENPSVTLRADHLTVTGEGEGFLPGQEPLLSARVVLDQGRATLPGTGVTASGIGFSLPMQWPLPDHGDPGRLTVSRIRRHEDELGGLDLDLHPEGERLLISGRHQSRILPGLSLRLEGMVGRNPKGGGAWSASLQATTAPVPYELDVDLGRFAAAASGMRLTGDVRVEGSFSAGREGVRGSVETRLDEGRLVSETGSLRVEGLRAALRFPELPSLRTGPQQELFFQSVQAGNFLFTEGSAAFQIESPESFFLERTSFHWCGGSVDAHAVRVSPAMEDFQVVLYCDRLVLSRILEQFGTVRAEGEGTVNGKIPLQFRNGSLTFSDGFLYSTPGKGGTIRLTGTEVLTAGIPPSSPQYSQLDLASEALKDYSYQWAKLGMNSQGETLVLRLQMDGKPARPLPFVYRRDIGAFARVEAGGKGSEFQGIRLDVNFKLPLDQILRYQNVFRGMQ